MVVQQKIYYGKNVKTVYLKQLEDNTTYVTHIVNSLGSSYAHILN